MKKLLSVVTVIIGLAAGCDTSTTEDQLRITFAPYTTPVRIDTRCDNGGCIGEEQLTAMLAFDADATLPEETEVQFLQYRIDYELTEIKDPVPYFASPVDLSVFIDQTTSFTVYAAGQIQRDFVYDSVGDTRVDGAAHLRLAGYDQHDDQVFLERQFDISFGDFYEDVDDATSETTTP